MPRKPRLVDRVKGDNINEISFAHTLFATGVPEKELDIECLWGGSFTSKPLGSREGVSEQGLDSRLHDTR